MAFRASSNIMHPTLLYISPEVVIPVPFQVRDKLRRDDRREAE